MITEDSIPWCVVLLFADFIIYKLFHTGNNLIEGNIIDKLSECINTILFY